MTGVQTCALTISKIKRAIIGEGAIISDGVEIDGTEEVYVVGYNEKVGVPKDED